MRPVAPPPTVWISPAIFVLTLGNSIVAKLACDLSLVTLGTSFSIRSRKMNGSDDRLHWVYLPAFRAGDVFPRRRLPLSWKFFFIFELHDESLNHGYINLIISAFVVGEAANVDRIMAREGRPVPCRISSKLYVRSVARIGNSSPLPFSPNEFSNLII